MRKAYVNSAELTQLGKDVYNYIKGIDVGCVWHMEFLSNDIPNIAFKVSPTTVEKQNMNIKGDYEADFMFTIYYYDYIRDTEEALNITDPLNLLADEFDKETNVYEFSNLVIQNEKIKPVSLQMTTSPQNDTIEDGKAVYSATYTLRYRKRGNF